MLGVSYTFYGQRLHLWTTSQPRGRPRRCDERETIPEAIFNEFMANPRKALMLSHANRFPQPSQLANELHLAGKKHALRGCFKIVYLCEPAAAAAPIAIESFDLIGWRLIFTICLLQRFSSVRRFAFEDGGWSEFWQMCESFTTYINRRGAQTNEQWSKHFAHLIGSQFEWLAIQLEVANRSHRSQSHWTFFFHPRIPKVRSEFLPISTLTLGKEWIKRYPPK